MTSRLRVDLVVEVVRERTSAVPDREHRDERQRREHAADEHGGRLHDERPVATAARDAATADAALLLHVRPMRRQRTTSPRADIEALLSIGRRRSRPDAAVSTAASADADLAQRPGATPPSVAVRRPGDPTHFPAWSPGASFRRSRPPARRRPTARPPVSPARRRPSVARRRALADGSSVVAVQRSSRLARARDAEHRGCSRTSSSTRTSRGASPTAAAPPSAACPVFGWGEVYPTVIAPVWALVEDRYVAYHVTLALDAVVMSLAAIPAYFLARLFVSRALVAPGRGADGRRAVALVHRRRADRERLLSAVPRRPSLASRAPSPALDSRPRRPRSSRSALVVFTRIQGVAMLAAYAGAVARCTA